MRYNGRMESTKIITEYELLSNLASVMKRRKVTISWLAKQTGMNLTTVWRKVSTKFADEAGKPRTISAIELHKMSLALKVPMHALLNSALMNTDFFWKLKPFEKE